MPQIARHMPDIEQAMSIRYNNLVYEMKEAGADVIVLSLGEAFFDIPLWGFDDLPYPDIYHYSHSRGIPRLREQIAVYYHQEYSVPVDPASELIITAGSKIAIHMAFMAMLDPGSEVLIPEPAWVSYPEQVKLCHGVPIMIPLTCEVSEYERYVTPRTRAIVINSPHNPRGLVYSHADLTAIYALAERHDLHVISDEAYSDFVLPPTSFISAGRLDPEKRRTVICNSISKNFGMSGWRIGYSITSAELTTQLLKINQHLITCPATILEHYLSRHFDDVLRVTKPQISAVVEKRRQVQRHLDELGVEYLPGEGTFYLFVSIAPSSLSSEAFCERLLREHHVSVVPGVGYGDSCDKHVRVSVGTESMERTRYALTMLRDLIAETSAEPAGVLR